VIFTIYNKHNVSAQWDIRHDFYSLHTEVFYRPRIHVPFWADQSPIHKNMAPSTGGGLADIRALAAQLIHDDVRGPGLLRQLVVDCVI